MDQIKTHIFSANLDHFCFTSALTFRRDSSPFLTPPLHIGLEFLNTHTLYTLNTHTHTHTRTHTHTHTLYMMKSLHRRTRSSPRHSDFNELKGNGPCTRNERYRMNVTLFCSRTTRPEMIFLYFTKTRV